MTDVVPWDSARRTDGQTECPWGSFTPTEMKFCEENQCAWVTQPANTWSNVGFLLVAAVIWRAIQRDPKRRLHGFWIAPATVGVGSAFFHASSTLIGQACDLFGMYLFSAFVVTANARRVFGFGARTAQAIFALGVAASMALMFLHPTAGILVFALEVTIAGVLEVRLFRKHRPRPDYRFLLAMCAAFIVAFSLWTLDITGLVCDPQNHVFGGHAAWHLLNAGCLYLAYRFYATTDDKTRSTVVDDAPRP